MSGVDESDRLVRLFKQENPGEIDDDGEPIKQEIKVPWVDTPAFNVFIGVCIAANAITIGAETAEKATSGSHSVMWFVIELAFCFIFFVELTARLYFHRWGYFGSLAGCQQLSEVSSFARLNVGNIFDFIIVVIAVIDTFILVPVGIGSGSARFVAFLRFVRLVRLIRLIRLFRIFKELWLVANGLLDTLRTLFWVCGLLGIFIEICAIVTARVIGHNDELYDPYFKSSGGWDHEIYFKTVLRSMFTLFQIMTLDSWSDDIVRHIGKMQPGMVPFFIAFIAITNLGVLNVIVGIVIESTMRTSKEDASKFKSNKEKQRQKVFSELQEIFETADVDGNGTLSLQEVTDATRKPEVYNKLKMIDFPADRPEEIFNLLDYDGSGELTIEEFITGCLRMKGSAKSKDLLVAQVAFNTLRHHFETTEAEMAKFNEKIARLQLTARHVLGHGEHVFLNTREYRMRHPEWTEQHMPRMSTKDLEQAPWLEGAGVEVHHFGRDEVAALTNGSPAHALDVHRGNLRGEEPPMDRTTSNAIVTFDRAPSSPPRPPQIPAGMLEDRQRAAGMLSNNAAPNPGDELAIVQVPGAMPPESPSNNWRLQ